mmetsp:Transcript_41391/g.100458  ORF Transcript_41391/g.100458 Transcript_41391/m.100458 type:complete len:814 (-) Transcript_41391:553-2994(-)
MPAMTTEPPNSKVVVEKIDPRDLDTPDDWIPRHPELVRLTGRHPFNVEPTLPLLMDHGFITPAALHYVRNHGFVPKLEWSSHTLSVSGLVDTPMTFTMDDLLAMPAREIPVTLVCAGNRRKEENLVAQTIGFNWGAAGVSTSVWKGVLLRDVLLKAGVKKPADGANHVCFLGVENMPKGRYGTSINWFTAMDPACDVMLAYEQNGERLTPDHGYPLRLIIPGYIGGRMIKWLSEITVTTEESDNFFHYNDNRVLPEHVTAEIANAEGWWYKPDYIINELNINSAIASPNHLEVVPLTGAEQRYTVRGYCYTGGGRKVIRVELSTDGGKSWTLTKIKRPEQPTEFGRYWCWVFWEQEIDLSALFMSETPELLCRGWDAAMNRQPEAITWNVMGMMNNSYFRIKVLRCLSSEGKPALKFQHPTLAGPGNFGGWFEEKVLGPADAPPLPPLPKAAPAPAPAGVKKFTMAEVEKHTGKDDVWFVVRNKVYDGTAFLDDHPGGGSSILIVGGTDCTEEFEALHSSKAWKQLEQFYLGELDAASLDAPPAPPPPAAPLALDAKKWLRLPLLERRDLSSDTRLFRFSLPSAAHALGLPVGQHVFLKAKNAAGKLVMRAYTPVADGPGYVDFVIKVYFANVHPKFPDGGALTQIMEKMAVGDCIEAKGPMGEFIFTPARNPTFNNVLKGGERAFRNIGFISGGSGITPSLQTAVALLKQPDAEVNIWLLYANQSPADILCQDIIEDCSKDPRFKVWYTVDRAPAGWAYSHGFIDEAMLRAHMPPPADDTVVFLCGPPPMLNFACIPNLKKIGHAESSYFTF